MDAESWNTRYAATEPVWSVAPNRWVAELVGDLPPGRALDIAAGEGRHAVWLAEQGWRAVAVDFSEVGLARATQWAGTRGVGDRLRTVVADVVEFQPEQRSFDLVVIAYLQIPAAPRAQVIAQAAAAVAPGGHLLVVAHDSANLVFGTGGPQDPAVLYTASDVVADVVATDPQAGEHWQLLDVTMAQREVGEDEPAALDAVFFAQRVDGN